MKIKLIAWHDSEPHCTPISFVSCLFVPLGIVLGRQLLTLSMERNYATAKALSLLLFLKKYSRSVGRERAIGNGTFLTSETQNL